MNKKIHPFIAATAVIAAIIIVLVIITSQSCFDNILPAVNIVKKNINEITENKYADNQAGFSLSYPATVSLGGTPEEKLFLTIRSTLITNLDAPLGFDKKTAQEDAAALAQGQFGYRYIGCALEQSEQVRKIGGEEKLYGKIYMSLVCLEACDVKFDRTIIFYNNGYQIVITLSANKEKIINSMPEYFQTDPANCSNKPFWNYNLINKFNQTLIDQQGSADAQQWYETFNEIVDSIRIFKSSSYCETNEDCQQICESCFNKKWLNDNPEVLEREYCPYPPNFNNCSCQNNMCTGNYQQPAAGSYCQDKNSGNKMSLNEAKEIAANSDCVAAGELIKNAICNDYTGTWWIELEVADKPMCNPACVINVNNKQAEINWRCGGLIPE